MAANLIPYWYVVCQSYDMHVKTADMTEVGHAALL